MLIHSEIRSKWHRIVRRVTESERRILFIYLSYGENAAVDGGRRARAAIDSVIQAPHARVGPDEALPSKCFVSPSMC